MSGGSSSLEWIEDPVRWNRLVETFATCDLKQGFEWGTLRREAGWSSHRLAVLDGEQCGAAIALLSRSLPGAGALMYAPRGPLFDPAHPEGLRALLGGVADLARGLGAIFLRVSPGFPADDRAAAAALRAHGFAPLADAFTTWNTPRCTQRLDLTLPEEALWRQVRQRYREYVRMAPRRGLVVEESQCDDDLPAFYELLLNVARLRGFPIRSFAAFRSLHDCYSRAGALRLLVARAHGKLVGGVLGITAGRRSYLLYSSARTEAETPRHYVSPALYWEYIRRARAEGCERADFGSSGVRLDPTERDPGYGVYRFKAAFGCRFEICAPYHDLVFRPALYRAFRLCEARVLPRLWTVLARATPVLWALTHHAELHAAPPVATVVK